MLNVIARSVGGRDVAIQPFKKTQISWIATRPPVARNDMGVIYEI
jgi:hypothetical protein